MRVLTTRELNRALLARQRLLERSGEPAPRVLERMGALQAQYAPSMYVGLWSRLEGFERDALTAALERRAVVQGTLLRATIHLVSRRDWWPFAVGVREARRRWWLRIYRGRSAEEMSRAAETLRERLRDGPLPRKAIEELVGKEVFNGIGLWIDLVRAPPSGTWERRRADLFADAEAWVGPCEATEEEGIELLARRYLGAFGPASAAQFADWAGLPLATARPVLERVAPRRFRDEEGGELLDLPRAPLPGPDTPAPVRFLGTWDALLLAHARRAGVLPEEHRPRVFSTKMPQSVFTFLVDGRVAGAWRHEGGRIVLDPFEPLDAADRRALEEEGERLAELWR
jgi:winged helix DNA-binding protein